ncbi:hypothetical protein P2318_30735 [Myxococcaceae bacterium GXIMD 01537]
MDLSIPGTLDPDLSRALEAQDYGTALAMLRDRLPPEPEPWQLILLAFLRYEDAFALETELVAASQEALGLMERAVEAGATEASVAPLRAMVESVLAAETLRELAAERMTPESARTVPLEEVLEAASRLRLAHPARAAELYLVAARRDIPERAPVHHVDAGAALHAAGRPEEARPLLLPALALDWRQPALWPERLAVDLAATLLLEQAHAAGDDASFEALWNRALALGRALEIPFPTQWPHQERLLELLLKRREGARAAHVATRIEDSREYVPRALTERVRAARALAREQAASSG